MNTNLAANIININDDKIIKVNWQEHYNQKNTQNNQNNNNTETTSKIKERRIAVNGKVNALRTPEQIQAVKDYFLYHNNTRTQNKSQGLRNYCLVVFGMNTALRASDILLTTIGELINTDGTFKENIAITEKKTKKKRNIYLNNTIREAITMYLNSLETYSLDDFIFKSNKTKLDEETNQYIQQPIGVGTFWRLMNQCGKDLGYHNEGIHLGSHSCRKTWTRQIIIRNPNKPTTLIAASEALNHSSVKTTYTYADISADEQRELFISNEI